MTGLYVMKKMSMPRSMRRRLKRKKQQRFYESIEHVRNMPWIRPIRYLSMTELKKIYGQN
jgi:hypothetical protein